METICLTTTVLGEIKEPGVKNQDKILGAVQESRLGESSQ